MWGEEPGLWGQGEADDCCLLSTQSFGVLVTCISSGLRALGTSRIWRAGLAAGFPEVDVKAEPCPSRAGLCAWPCGGWRGWSCACDLCGVWTTGGGFVVKSMCLAV